MFPTKIKTDRLIMKKPENNSKFINKLYSICSGESGEKITKYMSWNPHTNIKKTEEIVNSWVEQFEKSKSLNYMLIEKDKDNFIGMGGLSTYWEKGYGQLGCWLKPEFWRRGFSSERALSLIELNFEVLGLDYLEVCFDKNNQKCESAVSSYMSKVNGKKLIEYNETTGGQKRRTVKYGISNVDYKDSNGLDVINRKYYTNPDDLF